MLAIVIGNECSLGVRVWVFESGSARARCAIGRTHPSFGIVNLDGAREQIGAPSFDHRSLGRPWIPPATCRSVCRYGGSLCFFSFVFTGRGGAKVRAASRKPMSEPMQVEPNRGVRLHERVELERRGHAKASGAKTQAAKGWVARPTGFLSGSDRIVIEARAVQCARQLVPRQGRPIRKKQAWRTGWSIAADGLFLAGECTSTSTLTH